MCSRKSISGLILALAIVCHSASAGNDRGFPDTVKVEGGPLAVGQSIPLALRIVNDYSIGAYCLGLISTSMDPGFARYDSVVYINRMADPSVMATRIVVGRDVDGITPDTLVLGADAGLGNALPAGSEPVMEIYFTGLNPGTMKIDSGYFPPAGQFLLVDADGFTYTPQFVSLQVEIVEGSPPPVLTLPASSPQLTAEEAVRFDVAAESPVELPVTLSLVSLNGYDLESQLPANEPTLGPGNPAEFTWETTPSDVGIWLATFEACDSEGSCVTGDIDIQVVEDGSYLVSFGVTEVPDILYVTGLSHGDYEDDDPNPEIVVSGLGTPEVSTFQLYDFTSGDELQLTYTLDVAESKFALQPGYFDSDDFLDAVVMGFSNGAIYRTTVFHGDGDNGVASIEISNDGHVTRSGTLGEFTGDNHLDFAVTWNDGVRLYAGDSEGGFVFDQFIGTTYPAMSINSADFDNDGDDDLAVGTEYGVTVYLHNGSGSFSQAYTYAQTYGSLEIEVTNKGSDFDGDGNFDLCISTPSVGETHSNMMVYLGVGDGSFSQQIVRTVKGQIFGNCVADINNDGELDIAYVNGAHRFAAVLFGDGNGSFTNELRFAIPHPHLQFIDCLDADLDGDVDLLLAANAHYDSRFFYLKNELDPSGFASVSFSFASYDNSDIELISPTGKVFNRNRNTMSSGDYYRRNLNVDPNLDNVAAGGVVESGEYTLKVTPRPNLPDGEPFSVEFNVDGQQYTLASDIPMRAGGYEFTISLGSSPCALPRSGSFVQANPPTFVWQGDGEFDFQLASDIDFNTILDESIVAGHIYSPESTLPCSSPTAYYWRVKPHGAGAYDCLYVINMVSGGTTACSDADGDGLVNLSDVVFIVNYIFRSGPAPDPLSTGDMNCDDIVNVADAVYGVAYIFLGGPAPCCP